MSAWPPEIVARARALRAADEHGNRLGEVKISKILAKEFKHAPGVNTVRDWIRGRTRKAGDA